MSSELSVLKNSGVVFYVSLARPSLENIAMTLSLRFSNNFKDQNLANLL